MTEPLSNSESRMLAQRLAAGDGHALEQCYRRYGRLLRRYLTGLVGPNDAEDVLQETFADVWRVARTLDPARSLEVWLFTIARRRAIDHLRRRRPNQELQEEARYTTGDTSDLADRLGQVEQIRQALASLPEEQRRVIELAYFEDLTQSAIASQLDVPLGTIKARMFRGLRQLGRLLREGGAS